MCDPSDSCPPKPHPWIGRASLPCHRQRWNPKASSQAKPSWELPCHGKQAVHASLWEGREVGRGRESLEGLEPRTLSVFPQTHQDKSPLPGKMRGFGGSWVSLPNYLLRETQGPGHWGFSEWWMSSSQSWQTLSKYHFPPSPTIAKKIPNQYSHVPF